jgi:hypothetical protein
MRFHRCRKKTSQSTLSFLKQDLLENEAAIYSLFRDGLWERSQNFKSLKKTESPCIALLVNIFTGFGV